MMKQTSGSSGQAPGTRRPIWLLLAFLFAVIFWLAGAALPASAAAPPQQPALRRQAAAGAAQITFAPVITATKRDTFPGASAEPGDTISYTIVVSNTGDSSANDVTVSDVVDLYTTYVDGSLRVTPLAIDDTYAAIGNTRVAITAANGLLANDVDPDDPAPNPPFNDGLTVVLSDTTSASGGAVSVSADGAFTYDPPAGFEGDDTFSYTVEDGHGLRDVATVTVTVSDVIWYIDNTAVPGGDGRSHSPLDAIPNSIGDADDVIFVRENGGGAYPATLTLANGQQVIGHDFGPGSFASVTGLTQPLGTTFPAPGSSPTLTSSGDAITLGSNNTVRGLTVGNTSGRGLTGTNVGTLTVRDTTLTGVGGILAVDTGTLDASFDALATSGSSTTGVSLTNVGGSLAATSGSIAGTSGTAFDVNGGAATITYPGAISQIAAARIVQVQNRSVGAGTITLSGNLSCNSPCTGIDVANNSGGTVTFSGSSKALNTGSATAITLSNNSGATVNFSGGGLDIGTTSGTGLNVTGGGTVNVTTGANPNTINVGAATALNVVNTTIGSNGLTFRSISANGGTTPGINLDNTGSSGFLEVTGDGGVSNNGSGGTIQNKSGGSNGTDGIFLINASNVRLRYMNVDNNNRNGIFGQSVDGLVLEHVNIRDNADQVAPDEAGLHLLEFTGTGSGGANPATFADILVSDAYEHNVKIQNSSGALSLDVNNSTFTNDGASTQAGNLFLFSGTGSADMTLNFDNNNITGSTTAGQLTASGLKADTSGGTMHVTATNSTFNRNNAAVDLSISGSGSMTFDVSDNPSITRNRAVGVNVFTNASSTGSMSGQISSNVIGTAGVTASGSQFGSGIDVSNEGAVVTTVLIDNNTVQEVGDGSFNGFEGIFVIDSVNAGTLNATITNNTIDQIRDDRGLQARLTSGGTVCANISGNQFSNIGGLSDMRVSQTSGTHNVTQANPTGAAPNLSTENGNATVDVTGAINFGQPACSLPLAALSRLTDGRPNLPLPAAESTMNMVVSGHPRSPEQQTLPRFTRIHDVDAVTLASSETADNSLTMLPAAASPGDTVTLLGDPFTLPAGKTFTMTFGVTIAPALPAGVASVQNQATVSGSNFDDVLSVDPEPHAAFPATNGETMTPVDAVPDLSLSKDDGGVSAGAGDTITYTLTYSNTGTQHASGVVLTETVPAHTTFNPGASTAGWSCAPDNSAGSACTLAVGAVNAGDLAATAAFAVDVDDAVPAGTSQLSNTAQIGDDGAGGSDPTPANNTATDSTPLLSADLVVSKSDMPDPVAAGGTLTYTVTITNNGPDAARDVVATDVLTDALTLAGSSGCAEDPAGAPTCSLGTIAAGSTVSYTLAAVVDSATLADTITNTVFVTSATIEAAPGDESATTTTTVNVVADLALTKTDSPDPVLAGSPLTYTLTLTNHGPSQAYGVTVTDTLPLAYNHTGNSCGASYTPPASLEWVVDDVPAGAVLTCVITGTVDPGAGGTMTNTAFVNSAASVTDPDPSNNSVEETTTVAEDIFSVDDVSQLEGDSGLTAFTFTISRANNAQAASVDVATAPGTAQAGVDYTALPTTTITFPAGGSLTQTVTVDVVGDRLAEDDETFFVILSNPTIGVIGDGQGQGTIVDDDPSEIILYFPLIHIP